MMKKETPVQKPVETREQFEDRRDHSESQYVRDKAFLQSMDEWRRREGKGGLAGF